MIHRLTAGLAAVALVASLTAPVYSSSAEAPATVAAATSDTPAGAGATAAKQTHTRKPSPKAIAGKRRACPFPDARRGLRRFNSSASNSSEWVRGSGELDDGEAGPGQLWRPGQLLVRYHEGVPSDVRQCMTRHLDGVVVDRDVALSRIQLIQLGPGESVSSAVRAMGAQGLHVSWAVPNLVEESDAYDDDPLFPGFSWDPARPMEGTNKQWQLQSRRTCSGSFSSSVKCQHRGLGVIDAWRHLGHLGDPRFRIGVIDTGMVGLPAAKMDFTGAGNQTNFSGLAARVEAGIVRDTLTELNDWPGPADPDSLDDHGTQVGHLIAGFGGNGRGGSGVMQRAALVPVAADLGMSNTLKAMEWVATRGQARVVNISRSSYRSMQFRDSLKAYHDVLASFPDVLWVFAASNSAFNLDTATDRRTPYKSLLKGGGRYRVQPDLFDEIDFEEKTRQAEAMATVAPCGLRSIKVDGRPFTERGAFGGERGNLICVAASDPTGQLANFSNYGRHTVEFAAPGDSLLTASPRGTFGIAQGTSFAAPLVAGVAGLVMSKQPTLDTRAVKCILMRAAEQSPLPPQNLNTPEHPAFLQPGDTMKVVPVYMAAQIVPGRDRLPADQLLRVMGIPNAETALRLARRTVQEMATNTRLDGDSSCLPPHAITTSVTYERGQVLIDWRVDGSVPVDRLHVRPSWGVGRGNWHFDLGRIRPGKYSGTMPFARGSYPLPWRSRTLDLRFTMADGSQVTRSVEVRINPDTPNYRWKPLPN